MRAIFFLLYDVGFGGYLLLVRLVSLFNSRAAALIKGRKGLFTLLEKRLANSEEKRVWFHFASLGEFEQGRPVMEQLKKEYPLYKLVITFYSPSGYEQRKNYQLADYVFYLPFDSSPNAKRFLDLVSPDFVVFVKYEFWPHYLNEIKKRAIPAILISAVFRPEQPFFKPVIGGFFRSFLEAFHKVFLQNEASGVLAEKLSLKSVEVAGDTRFDRVAAMALLSEKLPEISLFKGERLLIVAGSSWPAEEGLVANILNTNEAQLCCFVLVPHDVSAFHIAALSQKFPEAILYSQWDKRQIARVLIVDSVGLLGRIYQYADMALIGGGFSGGLHNILEATAYGVPVVFGPKTEKFWEAKASVEAGCAFQVADFEDFERIFKQLVAEPGYRENIRAAARLFINNHSGATTKILSYVKAQYWIS